MTSRPIKDAVTAVLVHDGEMFLARRLPQLAAFPGYHAFPGGKVDAGDGEAPFDSGPLSTQPPRLMRALVRELREELAFDLEAAAVARIDCLGEATTPAFAPLRFRTWFYRIELHQRPRLRPDECEITDGAWASPAEWCARFARGRLLCVPPTRAVFEALSADPAATAVPNLAPDFDPDELPWVESLRGLRMLLVRSHTLPPAQHTNCFWLGGDGHPRIVVDPSPDSAAEYQRLMARLREFGVDGIFLTHHHPDHRERANQLARELGVPIAMSADTRQRIARLDGAWFDGLRVQTMTDGAVLTHWLGEPVRLIAVPGHDAGQLALMPDSRAWCIVGDLIQGIGTVVVGGDEGNMAHYFESLEKLIALDPAVIIPSHGMAMGTTYRLRETLKHRRMREAQVLAGWQAGLDADAMLPKLYAGTPAPLLPYARINIESHLAKLRDEGRLPAA